MDLNKLFSKILPTQPPTEDETAMPDTPEALSKPLATRPRRVLPIAQPAPPPGAETAPPPNADDFNAQEFINTTTARQPAAPLPTYTPHDRHGIKERIAGFFRGGRQGGLAGAIEGASDPGKHEYAEWQAKTYAPAVAQRQLLEKEADNQIDRKTKAATSAAALITALAHKQKNQQEYNAPFDKGEIIYTRDKSGQLVPLIGPDGKPVRHEAVATAATRADGDLHNTGLDGEIKIFLEKLKGKNAQEVERLITERAKYTADRGYAQSTDTQKLRNEGDLAKDFANSAATQPDEELFKPSEEEIYNYMQSNKVDRNNAIEGVTRQKKLKYATTVKPKNVDAHKSALQKIFGKVF